MSPEAPQPSKQTYARREDAPHTSQPRAGEPVWSSPGEEAAYIARSLLDIAGGVKDSALRGISDQIKKITHHTATTSKPVGEPMRPDANIYDDQYRGLDTRGSNG